jgi:hypothetical protein
MSISGGKMDALKETFYVEMNRKGINKAIRLPPMLLLSKQSELLGYMLADYFSLLQAA